MAHLKNTLLKKKTTFIASYELGEFQRDILQLFICSVTTDFLKGREMEPVPPLSNPGLETGQISSASQLKC